MHLILPAVTTSVHMNPHVLRCDKELMTDGITLKGRV